MKLLDWPAAARDAPKNAAACALLVALIVAVIYGRQWWHVRGWPAESARAARMEPTGHQQHCGRHSWKGVYEITWISQDPPAGLPTEFTSREGCDAPEVGDIVTVVRVVNRDGSVHVWDDPATSLSEVAIVFGAVFAGSFALIWVMSIVRLRWRRWRGHDDRPRHIRGDAAEAMDASDLTNEDPAMLSPWTRIFGRRRR